MPKRQKNWGLTMKQTIEFTPIAWEDYEYWEQQDKKTLKKIKKLIKELQRHPETGEGPPERLRGDLTGLWSRHINEKDRMLYRINAESVSLITLRTHYSDS